MHLISCAVVTWIISTQVAVCEYLVSLVDDCSIFEEQFDDVQSSIASGDVERTLAMLGRGQSSVRGRGEGRGEGEKEDDVFHKKERELLHIF